MTFALHTLALSVLLAGCGEVKDSSENGDQSDLDGSPPASCETTVNQVKPLDGANGHYYLDPVVFKLSEPDSTASVEAEFDGEPTVSEDGLTITYMPDAPLAPSTPYAVTLNYCLGAPTVSFTTSHYGSPLEASTELEGATFTLSFTGGEMLIGENAGELMNAIFRWPIMVQILDVDGPYLNVLAGIGLEDVEPVEQNTCARTIEMNQIPTSELPYVSGRVEDSTFGAYGGEIRFESFDFDTTISADGQTIGGMRYEAVFGVEEIVTLLPDFGDVDSLCTLASNLDIPCEACPSNTALSCIRVSSHHIEGMRVDNNLVPITEPGTHEDCDSDA